MLWSSWQPQVLLEVRPSDVPKVLNYKVGRQNHTLVRFLQIKLPACRVIIFLENDKKFSKFGLLKCNIFTISQLKKSKKPRGYRIFSKTSFDLSDAIVFANNLCSKHSHDATGKIIKKSFGNLVIFSNFLKKIFKNAKRQSHYLF